MIYCDGCNLLYHLDCLTPKLKEIPEVSFLLLSCWFSSLIGIVICVNHFLKIMIVPCMIVNLLVGLLILLVVNLHIQYSFHFFFFFYYFSMLPAGPEILSRQNREDDETEKYIAMSLKDCIQFFYLNQ